MLNLVKGTPPFGPGTEFRFSVKVVGFRYMSYFLGGRSLTFREAQLIRLAQEGLTDKAISLSLGISLGTVSTYWSRLRMKAGTCNRTELIAKCIKAEQQHEIDQLNEEKARLLRLLNESIRTEEARLDRYRNLLEHLPDAVLVVDESANITFANRAAHDLFAFEENELNAVPLPSLLPERLREAHHLHFLDYLELPDRRWMGTHLETPGRRKDGTEVPIRASLSVLASAEGAEVICVLRAVQ